MGAPHLLARVDFAFPGWVFRLVMGVVFGSSRGLVLACSCGIEQGLGLEPGAGDGEQSVGPGRTVQHVTAIDRYAVSTHGSANAPPAPLPPSRSTVTPRSGPQ